MTELFEQMFTPGGIMFKPFLIGCMGSLTFGVVGSYVTARRISYIGTGISHAVIGGIGAGAFIQHLLPWELPARLTGLPPTLGAFAVAVLTAIFIGSIILKNGHKADSVITAVMVVGMSLGLLFLYKTPGYFDPKTVLFGDILLVSRWDVVLVGLIDATVVFTGILLYNRLLLVCFDEEFARLRGIRAGAYFQLLLVLTALTTVVMMKIVGVVMVIALLTLPAMTASIFGRKLWHCMVGATVLCFLCVSVGLALSYVLELPSGPLIVVLCGFVHLLASGGKTISALAARRGDGRGKGD